ncbi:biotin--[acetyl-CoA-carboxylase] ligase [Candidatus Fermentibacteria bacterium]|nr:MAG: biotin--[acetyl-CoA-carboxylase] ligase [Candidatus Fermentibacteria bacterium]
MAETYRTGRWLVHKRDSVDSTRNRVREGVSSLPDLSVVTARIQTEGRGRLGRIWVSPVGGLYFSILMKPSPPSEFAPCVSLLCSLILCREMEEQGFSPELKWPNDVILQGKKVAGVLAECGSSPCSWFSMGMGVNLNSVPDVPGRTHLPAGSWNTELGAEELLNRLLNRLDARWPDRNTNPLSGVVKDVSQRLWKLGEEVTITGAGEQIKGIVEGIGETGALILSTDSGERRFVSGELLTVQDES